MYCQQRPSQSSWLLYTSNAAATGGSYRKVASMEEAFADADIVYPKSWAPFAA